MNVNMRNSNIELLRFVMMLILCIWHILMHGYGLKHIADASVAPTTVQLILLALLAFPVDCFVFISGYYGIRLKREKLIRLLLQTTFFYLLCIILRNLFYIGEPVPNGMILTNWLPLTNRAWWFIAWYSFLMLLAPIIEEGVNKLSQKRFLKILICLIVINNLGTWLNHLHTGSDLAGLLTVYLIGRYVSIYKKSISVAKASFFFLLTTLVLIAMVLSAHFLNKPYYTWTLLLFCNPLIVIQAISCFFFAKGLNFHNSRLANFLGAHCFAIYLLTEFTDNQLYNWWRLIYEMHGFCVMGISVFVVCLFICILDLLQSYVQKPVNLYLTRNI